MQVKITVILGLALVAGVGCTGESIGTSGKAMDGYFPFDGTCRGWEYVSSDVSLDYQLRGELQPNPTTAGDGNTQIHTVEFRKLCMNTDNGCVDDELVRSFKISATRSGGVLFHEFTEGGSTTVYDPAVSMAAGEWSPEQVESTETGGNTFTSTFIGIEACDIRWAEWDGCAIISVDDGGAQSGIAGDWVAASGWHFVAFELANDTGRWSLQRGIFSSDEAECNSEGLPLLK